AEATGEPTAEANVELAGLAPGGAEKYSPDGGARALDRQHGDRRVVSQPPGGNPRRNRQVIVARTDLPQGNLGAVAHVALYAERVEPAAEPLASEGLQPIRALGVRPHGENRERPGGRLG